MKTKDKQMWQERRGVKMLDFEVTPLIDNSRAFIRQLILREKMIYMLGYSNKKPSKSVSEPIGSLCMIMGLAPRVHFFENYGIWENSQKIAKKQFEHISILKTYLGTKSCILRGLEDIKFFVVLQDSDQTI